MGKGRSPCCDKTKVKKGPWSPAEDLKLIAFIQRNGHENWRSLPKLAGLARCGKSCRLRWINYLRPDVKRGNFTSGEEEKIIRLHESLGNRWSRITSYLPGRTDNEIKNVWNTHLKKRVEHRKKSREGDKQSSKDMSIVTSSSSSSVSVDIKVNLKEMLAGSSSFMSYESNVEVMKPKSCDEVVCGNKGYDNKTRSSEEVNKPLEADFDFWSMLDMDNLGSYAHSISDVLGQDKVVDNQNSSSLLDKEAEQKKWLKHLERELGLEAPKEEDDFGWDLF